MKKIVFLVIDGLADLPINGATPLKEAKKPNLDYLAKNGLTGEMTIVPNSLWEKHGKIGSHTANIALLGYNPEKFPLKRGPLEAVGADIPYQEGHLAARCNFATVDKDVTLTDRRAGRNTYGLNEITRYISQHVGIGVPFTFLITHGHRTVLIIQEKLSDEITGNDPYKPGERVKRIQALKPEANRSAELVQQFVDKAHDVMQYHPKNAERMDKGLPPANYILVRQAGNKLYDLLPHFTKKWNRKAVCIAEKGVMRATCMLAGFQAVTVPESSFEDILDFIFENITEVLTDYDFVYVHIKGPVDEAAHDGSFKGKQKGIEKIDRKLEMFRKFKGVFILTCDHITSTKDRAHMPGKVPLLVYGLGKDKVKTFDESSVKKGKLKNYNPRKLWKCVFKK